MGLMGEANLRFARGETELAKKMCFEIIRQAPDAYEPYLTLAQIYENHNVKKHKGKWFRKRNNLRKVINCIVVGFLMLAGHLQPSNADIWCQLAEVELQENQISAAVNCYNRAIHGAPKDVDLHMKRLKLIQEKCMFFYNIYV